MKTMKNRVSALVVALVMMLSLFSVGAIAWESGEGFEVYWNDEKVGTITYDEMAEAIKDTADITYSGRKTDADKNTAYTGKVFTFDKVLEKVNLTSKWEAAPDATSVLFWNDASYNAELEKSAVKETRNAYKDDGTVASSVPVGFMQAEKKGKVYFQLVYGQTSFEDENASNFVKFDAKGNTKIKISTPGLKVYWNDTNVGTVSYETMVDSVSQATKTKKYSAINRKGTYDGNIEGYVYEFSRLLKSVGVADEWASAPDQTKVFLEEYGEDGKQSVLSKKNLTEPRYYFANDADKTRGERVDPGFMDNGDEGFQFVYGQTKADDVNKSAFVSFAGVTNGTVKIYTPYEIVDQDGKVSYFHYEDLEDLWIAEGSKEYNYTCINTYPTFSTESFRGPTLKAVLNQAGIDLDSLSDTDVIRFDSSDGQGLDFTVKDIKATRYAFPNGESKNKFKGTTEAQLKDKVEVPYILSMNGRSNIRNIFGQIDPQEQQKSSHIKYITKITVKKDAAKDFEGTTPTIENNGKYYKGEKLNFDLELPKGVHEGFIYYTASTDGTAPAEPSYSSILYNYAQNQTDDKDYEDPAKASLYNSYVFTDAEKTIINVKTYVSGYAEPKTMTLTYTLCKDHVAAEPVKENEKEATCTEEGSYDEVVYCSECHKELSRTTKTVAKIAHNYKDGKCTVCGAADPDYKKDDDAKFTGLANSADKDGVWWYYTDGKIDTKHTGVDQNKYGWWRVENGKVNFKAQGIYQNQYGWWKTTDGKVTFKEVGVFQNNYGWWRVKDSKVDFNAQSIYQNKYGWWKTTNGKVTFKENGVFQNEYGWWKVKDSKVDFKFNGTASNQYGTWYIKNGKVDFGFNGTYNGNQFKNGKLVGKANANTTKASTNNKPFVADTSTDIVHDVNCKTAKSIKSSNRVYFSTLQEAIAKGYTVADDCFGK